MNDLRHRYRFRALPLTAGNKPLDFGGGGIMGSVDRDGRITAINAYHPTHGYVTLTAAPPFPEDQRYNPQAVRAYRASLVDVAGFGLRFVSPIVEREAWLIEDAIPCIRLTLENGVTAEVITFVPVEEPVGVVQWWRFSEAGRFAYLAGRLSLQRCAYTQLTEGGPIPMPSVRTSIVYQRMGAVELKNADLGWAVALLGEGCVERDDGSVEFTSIDPIYPQVTLPGDTLPILKDTELLFGLGLNQTEATTSFLVLRDFSPDTLLMSTLDAWRKRWQGWRYGDHPLDLLLRRGLVYGLHCCVPVNDEATCIISDHQVLPLSWNRDAYYVALALLRWRADVAEVVRRHLLWIFEVAEQPGGAWGRAHLANGKIKDPAFQLDQQLFPLLELAEYIETTRDRALWERLSRNAVRTVDAICAREVPGRGLFSTEETPADDAAAMPYHLSSHILLWHTFRRLGALIGNDRLSGVIERVYEAIWREFVADREGRALFAYITDGAGKHQFYHDANDMPLALAPAWDFCPADNPIWRATMAFAFSPANQGGYYPGPKGGLGSVHTADSWPLGDVQAYIVARLTGNAAAEQETIERLRAVAQLDGALPEAYSAASGQVVSKHWFAWPGAALALCVNQLHMKEP